MIEAINEDAEIAAGILRVVNASREDEPASDLLEAGPLIGGVLLGHLAIVFSAFAQNRKGKEAELDYGQFWSGALACGLAAYTLARARRLINPLEAFAVGMLMDVGKLALLAAHPRPYSALFRAHGEISDSEILLIEKSEFGYHHLEISAGLLVEWGIPSSYSEAVLQHSLQSVGTNESSGGAFALAGILSAARTISRLLTADRSDADKGWRRKFFALTEVSTNLKLDLDTVYQLCNSTGQMWTEWAQALDLPTQENCSLLGAEEDLERRNTRIPAEVRLEVGDCDVSEPLLEELQGNSQRGPSRILIIDDDERMLRLLRHHLTREGFEVFMASSSDQGLHMALELSPQIVITDWMMPGMSGVKLCETLTSTEIGRKMYKLMVTAREDDAQVLEAFKAGADDYIVKPFNPRVLLARVHAGERMIRMREKVEESERVRQRQVAELGVLTRRLRAAAMTDALTELPNRRFAMTRLDQEWEASIQSGRSLSVVMIDIDFFKRVNDDFGHDTGDVVLKEVSNLLRTRARKGDVVCRLGGEEFVSINSNCDLAQATICAERLREAVEAHIVHHGDFNTAVTLSLGVAVRHPSMGSYDDLLRCADFALYEAKGSGRNKVVHYEPPHDGRLTA